MDVVLVKTKRGRGLKICVDGTWFYASNDRVVKITDTNGCKFYTIEKSAE